MTLVEIKTNSLGSQGVYILLMLIILSMIVVADCLQVPELQYALASTCLKHCSLIEPQKCWATVDHTAATQACDTATQFHNTSKYKQEQCGYTFIVYAVHDTQ
jgi:hypothetical protein